MSVDDLARISPMWVLATTAGTVMLVALATSPRQAPSRVRHLLPVLTLAGLALAAWGVLPGPVTGESVFGSALVLDGIGAVFGTTALVGAMLAVLVSVAYLEEHRLGAGAFYALLLLSATGALVLVYAGDLVSLFIGVELMSLGAYALSALRHGARKSQEAALKYFVYGAFASAFVVFGIALIFGEVGRLSGDPAVGWTPVTEAYASGAVSTLGWAGVGMVVAGLGFKIGVVPFHMWAPDVYEGAPTPATAYMAVGLETAAFAGVLRVAAATMLGDEIRTGTFVHALEVIAISTMVLGNSMALRQTSIKRLLAYVSIAHAGYVCVGLVAFVAAPTAGAVTAMAYYLLAYTAMTAGAFGVVLAFERTNAKHEEPSLDDLTGLAHRNRFYGFVMTVFMLALAGVPPSAGFLGRFAVFAAAVESDRWPLVVVAVFASVIGAYACLRVVVMIFTRPSLQGEPLRDSRWLSTGLGLCAGVSVLAGLLPERYFRFARLALEGWLTS